MEVSVGVVVVLSVAEVLEAEAVVSAVDVVAVARLRRRKILMHSLMLTIQR